MSTAKSSAGNGMEARIVDTARRMFMEEGFAGTRMSHIAEQVGINRPTLHYYFRTKEKMFAAVFSGIIRSLMPRLQDIITRTDLSVAERTEMIVDCYYGLFRANPSLPLFVVREMERDMTLLIDTCEQVGMRPYMRKAVNSLLREMETGRLRRVPIRFVFYTFYSMIVMPFITRNLGAALMLEDGETFDEMLEKWKPYIVRQMTALLGAGE